MTDEPNAEQAEESSEPVQDQEEQAPEQTPSVAETVRKAGKKDHQQQRSLDDLEPDVRRIVEDQVSAALAKKVQKEEYLTRDKVSDQIAAAKAEWDAEAQADRTFHTRLAAEGILPGSEEYAKIEQAAQFFQPAQLVTAAGVNALINAAGLRNAEPVQDDSTVIRVPGQTLDAEGPVGAKKDAPQYGLGSNVSDVEQRLKNLRAMEGE